MDDFARVKAAVDIVDVIGAHVTLQKAGSRLKGLCPFHAEKTPSFNVNPVDQYFKCFGCGKGGDVFVFLQEIEHLEVGEALHRLAERAGVTLTETAPGQQRRRGEKQRLYEILDLAAQAYRQDLAGAAGRAVVKSLQERGLGAEIQEEFGLGLAYGSSLLGRLLRQGYKDLELEAAGLGYRRGTNVRPTFRDRIMIPIRDDQGRTIGFGARRLKDTPDTSEPKYINSKDNPTFHKSQVLYGIDRARSAILKAERAVLVEGYTDVLMAHQAGVKEAIAALGTAVTELHVGKLGRLARQVVLFLDGDAAGQRAARRAVPLLLDEGLGVVVVPLEDGQDPGDFFSAGRGRDDFEDLVQSRGLPGIDYLLQSEGANRARSFDERSGIAQRLVAVVGGLRDPIRRSAALEQIAKELGFSPEALESAASTHAEKSGREDRARRTDPKQRSQRNGEPHQSRGERSAQPRSAQLVAQEELLIALLRLPELRHVANQLVPRGSVSHPLFARLFEELTTHTGADLATLLNRFCGEGELQQTLIDLAERSAPADPGKLFDGAVKYFGRQHKAQQGSALKDRHREALSRGDADAQRRFLAEYKKFQQGGEESSG